MARRADTAAAIFSVAAGLVLLAWPVTVRSLVIGGAPAAALVATGCCGLAVSGATWWPEVLGRAASTLAVAAASAVALAGGSVVPLAAVVCGVTTFELGLWWFAGEPPEGRIAVSAALTAVVFGVATAAGVTSLAVSRGPERVAGLVAAVGLLGFAAAGRARAAGLVLVAVPAVVAGVGLAATTAKTATSTVGAIVALSLAAGATAAAGLAPRVPALAIGLLAMAAAATPVGGGATALLACAAVLAIAIDRPFAAIAAVPGLAAAAAALLAAPRVADHTLGFTVAGAAVAVLLSVGAGAWRDDASPADIRAAPAVAAAAWLVVAPSTWRWTGAQASDFEQGVAVAIAAGGIAAVVGWLAGQTPPPWPASAVTGTILRRFRWGERAARQPAPSIEPEPELP